MTNPMDLQEETTNKVRDFYAALPFNYHASKESAVRAVQDNPIRVYADVDALLRQAPREAWVLDIGCGAGWFVNAAVCHYGVRAVGVDLCEPALRRAREVSVALQIADQIEFLNENLLTVRPRQPGPLLVNSIGVLHHTYDCHASLRAVAQLVPSGGYLHVGLYHRYGREPFLRLFQGYRERLARCAESRQRFLIEQEAYALYRELNAGLPEDAFLRSWFRDQVFHPHESQHTLEEVTGWLSALEFQCLSTSINRFQPVKDWRRLFEEEKTLAALSQQRNVVEKKYFPGFFTVCASKR